MMCCTEYFTTPNECSCKNCQMSALKYPRLYNLNTIVCRKVLHEFFITKNKFIEYCIKHQLLEGMDIQYWSLEQEIEQGELSEKYILKEQEETENQKNLLLREINEQDQKLCIALHRLRREKALIEKRGIKRKQPEGASIEPQAKRVSYNPIHIPIPFTLGHRHPFGRWTKGKKWNKKNKCYM